MAVALLGLVVSVLAGSAIQGMSYEGDASRRTRASLLADRALWQIEAALKLGAPPQPSHEESQEGEEFRILVDVQPLDLSQGGLGALLAPAPDGRGRCDAGPGPADGAPAAVPMPLYQVFVRVSWIEGLRELEVTRSTFAFDGSAAAQALGASAGTGAGEPTDDAAPAPEPEPEDLESE